MAKPEFNAESLEWRAIRDKLETRISVLQQDLEDLKADETKTAVTRGRIAEIRELLRNETPQSGSNA